MIMRKLGLFNGALILSFHGLDVEAVRSHGVFGKLLWRYLLNNSDRIVTCSADLATRLKLAAPYITTGIEVIHNGIDEEEFRTESLRVADPIADRDPYILNVATFERKKGQDVLLDAFFALDQRFSEYQLILVGADGLFLDDIRTRIDNEDTEAGRKVSIVIDAPHSTVLEIMAGASIFVLPSRAEPFGIVLLEAGLSSVPVIASRIGGIPEIITHDENGILVEPDNVQELRIALEMLLSNTAVGTTLAAQHYQRVVERFTWKSCASKYTDLIGKVP